MADGKCSQKPPPICANPDGTDGWGVRLLTPSSIRSLPMAMVDRDTLACHVERITSINHHFLWVFFTPLDLGPIRYVSAYLSSWRPLPSVGRMSTPISRLWMAKSSHILRHYHMDQPSSFLFHCSLNKKGEPRCHQIGPSNHLLMCGRHNTLISYILGRSLGLWTPVTSWTFHTSY